MTAFYNEIDPYAAQWLRNLIAGGHIAPGVVDERPIQEIEPWELVGYSQCHFFAGIGIWSHALRRAGWPDDRPIWTGSCPCQPFSNAGQRKGISDDRHLWPYWFDLIRECKPSIVVGEQVTSKDGLGWLDLVSADLEGADYAFGASDLCAAGFGGAHIRQRLYFVGLADSEGERLPGRADDFNGGRRKFASGQGSEISGLADAAPKQHHRSGQSGTSGRIEYPDGGATGRLEYSDLSGEHGRPSGREQSLRDEHQGSGARPVLHSGQARSIDDADWLLCRNPAGEPSWRPVEPGTFPLAHGVAARMGKLRAYGNGLDAETASKFCEIVKEISDGV